MRSSGPIRRTVSARVIEATRAIGLCHNVTPVYEDAAVAEIQSDETEVDQQLCQRVTYQASSPDEVCCFTYLIFIFELKKVFFYYSMVKIFNQA